MKSWGKRLLDRAADYIVWRHIRPLLVPLEQRQETLAARLDTIDEHEGESHAKALLILEQQGSALAADLQQQREVLLQVSQSVQSQAGAVTHVQDAMYAAIQQHTATIDALAQQVGAEVGTLRQQLGAEVDGFAQQVSAKTQAALAKQLEAAEGLQAHLSELIDAGRSLLAQHALQQRDLYAIRQAVDPDQVHLSVETDYPLAVNSPDHLVPWGTRNDNSRDGHFNAKLYEFTGYRRPLSVLDLGCAGGGFVKSLLEDGHIALGLEGSDYSLKRWRAEWGNVPHHLKTCDVTKPYAVRDEKTGTRVLFDVITAWELVEHIRDEDLDAMFGNVLAHLKPDGCFMCSISTVPDADPATGTAWHQSVHPEAWWRERFHQAGFEEVEQDIIGQDDWLRGSGRAALDWTEEQGFGFHIVLRKARS